MTGAEANGPEADDGEGESTSETRDDAGADQPEANGGGPPDSSSVSQDGGGPPDSGSGGPPDSGGEPQDGGGPPDSSGGPPDSGSKSQDGGGESRMTLIEHLTELRSRIIKAVIAVGVGALACWFLYPLILDLLLRPYCRTFPISERVDSGLFGPDGGCNLFVTDPLEPFGVRLTVAGYGGLALAMPVVLWQVWRFVAPALYRREKKYAIPFVLIGFALFVTGAGLAYWSLPRALDFLASIGGTDLVSLFSPKRYLGFVVKMMIAFGVGFQFPIVLIGLQAAELLENRTLRRNRSYAVVGIVALVAVITPSGDPFTLLALSVPMYVFYEISILFGVVRDRRRRRSARTGS